MIIMAENQKNNDSNQTQGSTEIKLTQEQFEQLINASNRSNNENKQNKSNIFVKGYNKTKDSLDTGTRGMEGSVFSIGRWIVSFVKEMIDGLREYMKMRQNERKQNKEDE